MDTVETTPTPAVEPVATPEAVAPTADAPSIADHAEAFSPDHKGESAEDRAERIERARDDAGRFAREPRHRAQSQRATAEDVPRIKELTKKWRTEETERKALAEKYAALEKEVQTLKAPKPVEPPKAPEPFTAKKPSFDDYKDDPDPLDRLIDERSAYNAKKTLAEQQEADHRAKQSAYERDRQVAEDAELERKVLGYRANAQVFAKTTPDFDEVLAKSPMSSRKLPPLLRDAMFADARGPEFAYTLAKRSDLLAEMIVLSDGQAITDESVANTQRLLALRMPVAVSGSTASPHRPYVPPAAPPNPERTGPIKTNEPPGEGSSIAEHSRYYAYKPKH